MTIGSKVDGRAHHVALATIVALWIAAAASVNASEAKSKADAEQRNLIQNACTAAYGAPGLAMRLDNQKIAAICGCIAGELSISAKGITDANARRSFVEWLERYMRERDQSKKTRLASERADWAAIEDAADEQCLRKHGISFEGDTDTEDAAD